MALEAVALLLHKLVVIIEREAERICCVPQKIREVEREFRRMQDFLKDAEGKSKRNEGIRGWVNEIRELACDCEDVIDTFLLEVESYNTKGIPFKIAHMHQEMKAHSTISSHIDEIMRKLRNIDEGRKTFDVQGIHAGRDEGMIENRLQERREIISYEENPNIVGLHRETTELVAMLKGTQSRPCVVSIVGPAGLGKTTLAKKVFREARNSFTISAWVYVSQNCKTKEVLRDLCKAFLRGLTAEQINYMAEREMREKIAERLREERYLVVLDDVWTLDAWNAVRGAFPQGETRSRIVLTTRHEDVARHADALSPFHPPFMNPQDSYQLFCNTAFLGPPCLPPPELKVFINEIVFKCGGFPLALVAVGGLLSRKPPTAQAWQEVVSSLTSELIQENGEVTQILSLSFDDLHHCLKSCLLYCCAFPEDSDIPVRRLLRLWIAEGLIEKREGRTLEGIAMDNLYELVNRSLVQSSKCNSIGEIKSCRVHDLVRELLIRMAKDRCFFTVHDSAHDHNDSHNPKKIRRLAAHLPLEHQRLSLNLARCFMSFAKDVHPTNWHEQLIKKFKLLRVLDLEGVTCVDTLPSEIGDLALLAYLGLRYTSIKTLPRSTKYLLKLQTFDVRGVAGFPFSRFKLHFRAKHLNRFTDLRHLCFGNKHGNAMKVPDDFGVDGSGRNLRTLSYVKSGAWVQKGLCTMTILTKMGIHVASESDGNTTMKSIAKLKNLERLHLQGHLGINIRRTEAFGNLVKLTLVDSLSTDDPLLTLQGKMRKLKHLRLFGRAYQGRIMKCGTNGFPQLEVLIMERLEHLEDLLLDAGAFPLLRFMRIASCNSMVKIPEAFKGISTLQVLKLIDMPTALVLRIQGPGNSPTGEDWRKIQHIPSTIVTTSLAEMQFDHDWKLA